MPRLSNNEYIVHHQFLRWAWLNDEGAYSYLSHNAQRTIHDYYQPDKELTDEQLVAHRRKISQEQPNLPAAAGKAARELFRVVKARRHAQRSQTTARPRSGPREIRVRAVVRPEIDVKQLSRALIELAQNMSDEQFERFKQESEKNKHRSM